MRCRSCRDRVTIVQGSHVHPCSHGNGSAGGVFSAQDRRDGKRVAAAFAEDGFYEIPSFELRVSSRSELAKFFGVGSSKFSSDERNELESAVSDGRMFALQWRSSGSRSSNGEKFDYRGASVGHLRDGLITSWTDYFDPAALGSM